MMVNKIAFKESISRVFSRSVDKGQMLTKHFLYILEEKKQNIITTSSKTKFKAFVNHYEVPSKDTLNTSRLSDYLFII